ncbi:kunitz-type serine protease inhibitor A-like [Anticarsia gemmatalis]|uniref:kunitz-type serine protease inhibitor A-like n=1 Tax=Anticarsia gemmatalis TaxID=129554 RepID=UPI003F776863
MFSYRLILFFSLYFLVHNVRKALQQHSNENDGADRRSKMMELKRLNNKEHCKFQPSTFRCANKRLLTRYYYDMQMLDCIEVQYGHCGNAYNNFPSRDLCKTACIDEAHRPIPDNYTQNVYCHLQPEFGECHDYYPMYYYDINVLRCKGFSFSGCGGNRNRFPNSKICMAVCDKLSQRDTVPENHTKAKYFV